MFSPAADEVLKPIPRTTSEWTDLQRVAFCFAFVYFMLDALPSIIYELPGGPAILAPYWSVWLAIVSWFGKHILHLPHDITHLGLGDSAFGYVLILCQAIVAGVVATVWTLTDTRSKSYPTLHYWLRVCVRYSLAFDVLGYGITKLFQVQFPSPPLVDLIRPLGYLPPRGLLWNFMGFSRTYQVFAGGIECLGAVLLFSRRTTLLGALLLTAALGNVLVLDISYGVGVKRIAANLLLLAMFLILPDLSKLMNLFLFHRPVPATNLSGPHWNSKWMQFAVAGIKATVVGYFICSLSLQTYAWTKQLAPSEARPALYGLYRVQQLVRNGRVISPADPGYWQLVAIDGWSKTDTGIAIRLPNEKWEWYQANYNARKHMIIIWHLGVGRSQKSSLSYVRTGPDNVLLKGPLDNQPTEITLHRIPAPAFPLEDPDALRWIYHW
jgi:hypothetical protein